jgi:peptidoglycan hydrolase-like protein with peptidoglycan-binding domain
MTGDNVKDLQIYLNNHDYPVATTGPGSKGNETTRFGAMTRAAVIAFQKANNLIPDGIVGPLTNEKIK